MRAERKSPLSPISVLLVDDHKVVTRGVRSYRESFPDVKVVGAAASGEEALAGLDGWLPDVVVMDLLMPGGMDGIEATRQVRARSPHTQVVVLTASTDEARLVAVLRAGAIGYVRKDADPELLLAAVRGAAAGRSMIDPAVAGLVLQDLASRRVPGQELTEREQEVLRHLARGGTNREIAEALSVSDETVKTHVGNILSKLHLAHRTQAVVYALKRGLVSLDDLEG
jgi:two-component system, NarL family, response regulator LiaR